MLYGSIGKFWRRYQRSLDMRYLWPVLVKKADRLAVAKAAFFFHMINDPAWYKDFSEKELIDFVARL